MYATLTELAVRAATPEQSKAVTIWDGSLKHFGVRISPGGTKTFVVLLGSGRRHAIGRYPTISLVQARTKARQLLAERTLGRFLPKTITWDAAVDEYIAVCEHKTRPRTSREYRRTLKCNFGFGSTRLTDITKYEIARKLDKLHETPSQQRHALIYARMFFKWAQARDYVEHNPCATATAPRSQSRSRVLTDDELRRVWIASDECGTFGVIVKLLILTGQRRGETAALEASWKNVDTITLPKEITKNGREHTFPIGPMAASLLAERTTSGGLFLARWKETKFSGWSKSKAALDRLSGVSGWTLHDLRRTFATNLAALGTPIHVTERFLNHVSGTPSYSTRYRKAKASKGLTGSFGDRSWPRKTII
jgi:integrase